MNITAPAILVATRPHGETAVIARLLTEGHGLIAGYVAGGRGRQLRPVVIPGNLVSADLRARSESQLPFLRLELVQSRGPWLGEPLASAGIGWACALTASALPERQAYPALYAALAALLDALCQAPSARGWLAALVAYEALMLRELGYGGGPPAGGEAGLEPLLEIFARQAVPIGRYLLAGRQADVMAARAMLLERLNRMNG